MSRILLKKARIYDESSTHHLKQRDILVERGIITEIKASIKPSGKFDTIESKNLCVSPGWIDIGCYNGEPGMEHREDLQTLRNAAGQGGYIGIVPFPTKEPTTDNKGQIEYLLSKNQNHLVQIYPVGALTKGRNGKDMAELLDLAQAGAITFSDGQEALMGEGQVQRSMLYLKGINANMIYVVNSKKPDQDGQVNEGKVSVSMGVEGIPSHQEKVAVDTVLRQIDYTGSTALIQNISLGWAAEKIAKSRKNNKVDASVAYFNLSHNEEAVAQFDGNFKVLPPLREESERRNLCNAVEKGLINVITSNHSPKSIEEKDEPFGLTPFGASTIETTFSSLLTYATEISLERIVHCLSAGPRKVLGISDAPIKKNETASFTLFDPSLSNHISQENLHSKSKNNPYIGMTLKGKVLGVLHNSKLIQNETL